MTKEQLLDIIIRANDVLMDNHDWDVDHTISSHKDTVEFVLRREANGAEKAIEILQEAFKDIDL